MPTGERIDRKSKEATRLFNRGQLGNHCHIFAIGSNTSLVPASDEAGACAKAKPDD